MKIKVESEKIIKAVKKLDGIEIVLENLDDAREAIIFFQRAKCKL
jgi:copper chaperone CopZ